MKTIKTKTFELAVYEKGDSNSSTLAIVIPGRLDTKDYIHNTSLVNYLASRGYFALSFDPSGTWESPGDIELYTTTNCLKAVDELIEYFGNRSTLLTGHSRGGTIAMLAGPKNPHVTHFIPIFSYYGVPSDPEEERIIDGKVVSYRDLPPGNTKTKEQKKFGLPLNYFEDGKQYDALAGLKNCTKPKLFFYGTEDDMNDPDDVKKAYEESAEPKMIHPLNSDHDYRYRPEIIEEVNKVVGSFLDKYPYKTMKIILVDAVDGIVIKTEGNFQIFKEMHDLLETFPNRKIILTGANDEQFKKFGLDKMPYGVFTLKHNPEKTDPKYFETMLQHFGLNKDDVIYFEHNLEAVKSAKSADIKAYFYDPEKKDLESLKKFLTENL